MPTPDLIPTAEAAEIIGVSTNTIHRLAESGKLPVALVGGGEQRPAKFFDRRQVEKVRAARIAELRSQLARAEATA